MRKTPSFFLNFGSTAVLFLLVLLAIDERIYELSLQCEIRCETTLIGAPRIWIEVILETAALAKNSVSNAFHGDDSDAHR